MATAALAFGELFRPFFLVALTDLAGVVIAGSDNFCSFPWDARLHVSGLSGGAGLPNFLT
jgi:hypothetical protein